GLRAARARAHPRPRDASPPGCACAGGGRRSSRRRAGWSGVRSAVSRAFTLPALVDRATTDAMLRAAAYVDARGDALARARAGALAGRAPAADAVAQLAPERSDASALRGALEVCDDLRALGDPRVGAWAEALARGQAGDGGFAPGRPLEARWFETGMIAGHLAKTRYARPALLAAAADFLARDFSPDRVQGGARSWSAIAAHAHCFANVDHDASDAILQWCGRELARG